MQKEQRQTAVLNIIRDARIGTQDELCDALEARGFVVNQSSISRDLLELGVVKSHGYYTAPLKPASTDPFRVISLEIAGESLIVAKTDLGLASAVCVKIDNAAIAEIVGTIAGEDTIFIAVRGSKEQRLVLKKVWEIFEQ